MSRNIPEVLTGALVLAVALGFAVYASRFAAGADGGSFVLKASFRSIQGVQVGTDVRLAGVKVGSVSAISLDPDTYRANSELTLIEGLQIPDDTAAIIASEGLLGGNFVELQPGGSPFYFAAGDEILDTQGAVSLIELLLKFVTGSGAETPPDGAAP